MRLGIGAYLVPFAFCYSTGLLMLGSAGDILLAAIATLFAVVSISIGLSGYFLVPLTFPKIGLFLIGAVLLVVPQHGMMLIGFFIASLSALWALLVSRAKGGMNKVPLAG